MKSPEGNELLDYSSYSATGARARLVCECTRLTVRCVMGSGISVSPCICLSHGSVV